jgi:hypothetical protein
MIASSGVKGAGYGGGWLAFVRPSTSSVVAAFRHGWIAESSWKQTGFRLVTVRRID